MAAQRLVERFAFSGGKVRRPGVDGYAGAYPVIEGVLLCGPTSLNRRRYKPEAFAGDRVKRYEGKPVFIDHSDGKGGRSYRDKIGWIENPRLRADGMPVGDVGIKPTHRDANDVLWDAEHKPDFASMSHVADCAVSQSADGWDDVTEMVMPASVDIVVGAATTTSYFEQDQRGRPVAITLGKYLEAVGKSPRTTLTQAITCRRLAEMDGMGDVPMPDDTGLPADESDPDAAIDDAFEQAGVSVWKAFVAGDIDFAAMLGKLKALAKAHGDVSDDAAADPPADAPAEESAKPRSVVDPVIREANAALKRAGLRTVELDHVLTYAALPEPLREGYARDLLRAAAPPKETPVSAGRGATTAAVAESKKATTPAATADEFKRLVAAG